MDSIFAIVMTLLVLEIKVPEFQGRISDALLWRELLDLTPLFLSYILSFAMLISYWVGHHFIVTIFAKNITRKLIFLNVPFLLMVALVPFSSHLLGAYFYSRLAIFVYGLNVIGMGLFLLVIRHYEKKAADIENREFSETEIRYSYIRAMLPIISALLAIVISFINPIISIYIFVLAVIFNLIPGILHIVDRAIGVLIRRK